MYSKVRDTLAAHGLEALIGTYAGVRMLPVQETSLIENAAAFIVGAESKKRSFNSSPRPSKPLRTGGTAPRHEYGNDGSFVFYVNRTLPSRVWSSMLTNGSFGYIAADSGMGNM